MGRADTTTVRIYRVDKREIGFIRFIIEAYEGLAVLTTLDAVSGHVCLRIAPGCEKDVESIMADLGSGICMERLEGEAEQAWLNLPAVMYGNSAG